jgi:hypothetical protein
MPYEIRQNFIASPYDSQTTAGQQVFAGFKPPTSNTTYTPNQFFDVVMPNASRGCLRIVAYLIRKTLGWCDAHGNPQREQIEVPYAELIRKAGLSRDVIRPALEEGVSKHFIQCIREGRKAAAGASGEAALYALKWDTSPNYARSLVEFAGFYEGEGYRTDIPNEFFDHLIPQENQAVIKVVGSVIRYSIGFQAKHGRRRQQATLAYSQIMKASGLASRPTLAGAIREALLKNYIVRLDPGYFSATLSERRSATYAVRWSDGFHADQPAEGSREIAPAGLWKKQSGFHTSRQAEQSGNRTRSGREIAPAGQSGFHTIETKPLNEKQKQQSEAADLLRREGFDTKTAAELAERQPLELIRRQLDWISSRNATKSRAGLLRRAIEGDWPKPQAIGHSQLKEREPVTGQEHHKHQFQPAYLAWIRQEEDDYLTSCPDDYARFTAKRERRRADLMAERSQALRASLLGQHDSESKRLADFQQFLGLPDFRQWDSTINHQPFHPQS